MERLLNRVNADFATGQITELHAKSVVFFFNEQSLIDFIAKRYLYVNSLTASLASLGMANLAVVFLARRDQSSPLGEEYCKLK